MKRWRWMDVLDDDDDDDSTQSIAAIRLYRARVSIKERHYLTCDALIPPDNSPWMIIYASMKPSSFIATVSIPPDAFHILLQEFSKHYQWKSGFGKPGRPPKLSCKHQALALVLHFYTAATEQKTLCEIFGIPPSTFSSTLAKAEEALFHALQHVADAEVRYPSKSEQRRWALQVAAREPLVHGVWGFLDGKNYSVKSPSCSDLQNAMYNGWLHSTFVTGTLLFGVDGTIVWGRHNFAGSWNDGDTSLKLQVKLLDERRTAVGTGVVADSAFPVRDGLRGKIRTPLKCGDLERASPVCREGLLLLSNAITALRQAAEWGMGAVEKVYRQLLLPLPFDPTLRHKRLSNMYKLYNFRVRRTGISQIRSTLD
ncbi:hypothetical protein AaE_002778 [Aphanomyces astaci]|uniref:DDE Tnp4 domain-containing protein n=1 Tax=Aphanomyces astaci TaxID=112090 RepID=A0A6A5AET0_APHAT|nr:hypothetical protein AaE_002778 [Aphanomyces astaci]